MKALLVCVVILACSNPTAPNDCVTLDFESGVIDLDDYLQDDFRTQFVIDPHAVASIESGKLVFSTDSVTFQFFKQFTDTNQDIFFDFNAVTFEAAGSVDLFVVGDAFDTLRVIQSGIISVPDSFFRTTPQIHIYGRADGLTVDNIEVCTVRD